MRSRSTAGDHPARLRSAGVCLALAVLLPASAARGADLVAGPSPGDADATAAQAAPPAVTGIVGPVYGPVLPPRSAEAERERSRIRGWRTDAVLASAGQIADLASTEYALSHPGTREGNPLLTNRAVRISVKLGVATVTSLGCYQLRKQGRHRHARLLAIASFAVGAGVSIHNVRMAHRQP